MNHSGSILIAGIGNVFLGDDGFGCELARRLAERTWPPGVKIVDFGIRSLDLTYALVDHAGPVILLDATAQGGVPGTLYTLELDSGSLGGDFVPAFNAHTLDSQQVLRTATARGGHCGPVILVGCEPEDLGGEEGRMGLSPVVASVLDAACERVAELVTRYHQVAPTPPRPH